MSKGISTEFHEKKHIGFNDDKMAQNRYLFISVEDDEEYPNVRIYRYGFERIETIDKSTGRVERYDPFMELLNRYIS